MVTNEPTNLQRLEHDEKHLGSKVWMRSEGVSVLERDKHLYKEKPDPGFSPNRNKEVVQRTINKAVMQRVKKHENYMQDLKERNEAAAHYLTSRKGAQSDISVERYLGKKRLAQLQGQKIVAKLKRYHQGVSGARRLIPEYELENMN